VPVEALPDDHIVIDTISQPDEVKAALFNRLNAAASVPMQACGNWSIVDPDLASFSIHIEELLSHKAALDLEVEKCAASRVVAIQCNMTAITTDAATFALPTVTLTATDVKLIALRDALSLRHEVYTELTAEMVTFKSLMDAVIVTHLPHALDVVLQFGKYEQSVISVHERDALVKLKVNKGFFAALDAMRLRY
jgi:hypothetical protein